MTLSPSITAMTAALVVDSGPASVGAWHVTTGWLQTEKCANGDTSLVASRSRLPYIVEGLPFVDHLTASPALLNQNSNIGSLPFLTYSWAPMATSQRRFDSSTSLLGRQYKPHRHRVPINEQGAFLVLIRLSWLQSLCFRCLSQRTWKRILILGVLTACR